MYPLYFWNTLFPPVMPGSFQPNPRLLRRRTKFRHIPIYLLGFVEPFTICLSIVGSTQVQDYNLCQYRCMQDAKCIK
jgi:hypothetical protein